MLCGWVEFLKMPKKSRLKFNDHLNVVSVCCALEFVFERYIETLRCPVSLQFTLKKTRKESIFSITIYNYLNCLSFCNSASQFVVLHFLDFCQRRTQWCKDTLLCKAICNVISLICKIQLREALHKILWRSTHYESMIQETTHPWFGH